MKPPAALLTVTTMIMSIVPVMAQNNDESNVSSSNKLRVVMPFAVLGVLACYYLATSYIFYKIRDAPAIRRRAMLETFVGA
jgi:branched-subunit amino acid transport protein AzlD